MNRSKIDHDQARLRPHLRTGNTTTQPARIHYQPDFDIDAPTFRASWQYPNPGDLRGIPVIGRGVTGAQPGSRPGANL